ncbi:selenium-dependent molybdenum cofactor biosynthesis protein YqeB [Peptoniphilus equinus]|uniref:Selenium-dependent molybdenum cofactor biosynthesis protein YqeB n=1 Tax=Peptoniphilus equinus TaxID=3016343 RepID=A0ABY7QUX3_9FIRM|nr:selenium-dependent molybdenum cofactor biosynthesis protein YqeB [Peptoniphilus equinus]WBW50585.1 selenium-dependent molybdenum cofactor biosynthesis protein YqeB [Peptoniphilus equinus]
MTNNIVIVRGGGDIATGSIQKLHRTGYRVLVLEREAPQCIRRFVTCAEAMYTGFFQVEDLSIQRIDNLSEAESVWAAGRIPIIADESGASIQALKPLAVVDGILAKTNLGTRRDMAKIVIGLGPGFIAGKDVHVVIETNRGHNLGRLIFSGAPEANTGNPGDILGFTTERILRSSNTGTIDVIHDLGAVVKKGDVVATVDGVPIYSQLDGMVRGMIRHGSHVKDGMKVGDVDPRVNKKNLTTISDKARAIGGGVLEALLMLQRAFQL